MQPWRPSDSRNCVLVHNLRLTQSQSIAEVEQTLVVALNLRPCSFREAQDMALPACYRFHRRPSL